MMRFKHKPDRFDALSLATLRKLYIDKPIIALQLVLISVVALDFFFTKNLLHGHEWIFLFSLVGSGILASLPILPTQKLLSSAVFLSIHITVAAFIIFVAPVNSPYELITFLLLYFTTYWFGAWGFAVSLPANVLILELAFQHQLKQPVSSDIYQLGLKVLLLIVIGGILARLHQTDLAERQVLLKTTRRASFERQRLQSLINSMADAVIATDYDGKILVYNGAALDLLNTNLSLEDQPLHKFLKTYSKAHHPVDLLTQARQSQTIMKRDDILLKVSPEEYLNLYSSVAQIHLGYGERGEEGFILLLRDITKEKSIEEQRDEFISVVSHELRTPIAIAEANVSTAMLPDMLKDHTKAVDLLEQAHKNILFLANLVNDITTLAHAERGDLEAELEDVDPTALLQDLAQSYDKEAKTKGLEVKTDIPKQVPVIRSNNYRLKEILSDFVVNALKYTEKGSVTLGLVAQGDKVRFSITDTGIGISQSDQHHVFSKFWRSEDYRTRAHSGTGLGLYVAKKLAERMHGTVGVESKLNQGSTFYLEVPLRISDDQSGKGGK